MIPANALMGWVGGVLLCLSPATQTADTQPLTAVFVSPAVGATVSPDLSVTVRIGEDGRPFTEAGERRWVQATIRNERGQTVAQFPLRDHGQGSDRLRGDGEWTAPVGLHLPNGQYRLVVAVQRGEQRDLRQTSFAVSTAHALPLAVTGDAGVRVGADLTRVETRLGELAVQVQALAARRPAGFGLFVPVVSLLSLVAIAVLAIRLWMLRPPPAVAVAPVVVSQPQPAPSGPVGERWRPLFGAMDGLQTAVTGMKKDLSTTFQGQQTLFDQRVRLASELVSLSESLASVDTLTAPAAQALKAHLRTLLAEAGIEPWEPAVGQPAPPDCEQRPDPENRSAPQSSVTRVLRRGFRMRHGEGWIVLVRPVVAVATGTRKEEKA